MGETAENRAPGTVLARKFRIVRTLGEGGMGAVYEIEHELTKHRRALKLLHAEVRSMPGIVERFVREASAAGRIGNPHIIETFDAGELDTGEPYVVMELLSGQTVSEVLSSKRRLGLAEMVDLVGQACDGVQAAHEAGIVHRDLKPDNLFVTARAGLPFVKILDFGISKFDPGTTGSMSMTREGSALGTPLYMPPEQVRGEKNLDARADIYALGVILYECAAGEPPYNAESLQHLAVLIHMGNAVPLTTRRPDLPAAFSAIVSRAMATDPGDRFPTARALADALRALPKADTSDMFARTLAVDAEPLFPAVVRMGGTVPAHTASPVSLGPATTTGATQSGAGRTTRLVIAAVGAILVAGAVAAALMQKPTPVPVAATAIEAPAAAAAPSAPPPVAAPVTVEPSQKAPATPVVVPAASTPAPSASAQPVAPANVARTKSPVPTVTATAKPVTPPTQGPARASEKHLATDNPI